MTEKQEAKKETKKKTTSLRHEIITDMEALHKLVKKSIDKGSENLEEVHQAVAKLPLNYLEKISKIGKISKEANKFQEKTISKTYKLIRTINEKTSDMAVKFLGKTKEYVS